MAKIDHTTTLSRREMQIAQAYAAGQSYRAIAEHLFIAPSTVRTHLQTIYRKLEISSKIQLHTWLHDLTAVNLDEWAQPAPGCCELSSVAIGPLRLLTRDTGLVSIADGLREDLLIELSRFRDLSVLARCAGLSEEADRAAPLGKFRSLGIDFVVDASIRRYGKTIRITVALVDVQNGQHLWAERYDCAPPDLARGYDDLTNRLSSILASRIAGAVTVRALSKPNDQVTAHDRVLRASWKWRQDAEALAPVTDELDKALALDGESARAHATQAFVLAEAIYASPERSNALLLAVSDHLERALGLDSQDSLVRAFAAMAYTLCGRHDMARRNAEEAMSINPNDVQAVHAKGMTEIYRGELDSGLDFILKARACDPTLTAHYLEPLIECHYMRGEYGTALETFKLWNRPPFYMLDVVAACQARLGRSEDARATRQLYLFRHPRSFNPTAAAEAHLRMIALPDSRRHWMDGYRKAGIVA